MTALEGVRHLALIPGDTGGRPAPAAPSPAVDANGATWYLLRTARDFDTRVPTADDPVPPVLGEGAFYDDLRHVLELLPRRPARSVEPLPGLAASPTGDVYLVDASGDLVVRRCWPAAGAEDGASDAGCTCTPSPFAVEVADPTRCHACCARCDDAPQITPPSRPDAPATNAPTRLVCDAAGKLVVCEPGILHAPTGLALDRRGLLWVADAAAHRVVVLRPDDGGIVAILGRFAEAVDVAVAPTGRIYVADRGGMQDGEPRPGRIIAFDAHFRRLGSFAPQRVDANGERAPEMPRPIAVMIDAEGAVLVADADHPRLLRFSAAGEPLAEVELSAATASVLGELPDASVTPEALAHAFEGGGDRLPRFAAGLCAAPCAPSPRDGGVRLATVHRALRLLRLRLARRFEREASWTSAALDAGVPGTVWHRVDVDADIPDGTQLVIETWTAERREDFALTPPRWAAAARASGRPEPFTTLVPDQLVQSPPGRFLRLRATLLSDGSATPSVRSVRVRYPRVSYLAGLPRVYRRDDDGTGFLARYLALFEHVFTRVEDRLDEWPRLIDLDAAPRETIDWLACLVDLTFDPSWPLARRRALVGAAMELYRARGTPGGLRRYVQVYTGTAPVIIEGFLTRPGRPALLGAGATRLGCTSTLPGGRPAVAGVPTAAPDEALIAAYAHRFTVLVFLDDDCDREVVMPVVDRIVTVNKPAHTIHTLEAVRPDARVGEQSTVGMDLVVGAREAAFTRIGGCAPRSATAAPPSTLGVSSVLGARDPFFAPPLDHTL